MKAAEIVEVSLQNIFGVPIVEKQYKKFAENVVKKQLHKYTPHVFPLPKVR